METSMKAGERIRALREAKCWTQAHLAGPRA
jgi:transcriptional regulator with XRE-family HTH domain